MKLPRVALLAIHDGRGLKRAAIESFTENARRLDLQTLIEVDDTRHELGFCGAVQEGWARLRAISAERPFEYVFWLEEDFTFNQPFDVATMARLLDDQPHLCQVALRRGPVNDYERMQAGCDDISMMWPDEYTLRTTYADSAWQPVDYLEHRLNWTTNPSLYRRELIERFEWPDAPRCEEAFSQTMIAEGYSFAYIGGRGAPWVTHDGPRTGHSY